MKTAKTGFVDQTSRLRKEKMHDIWFCGTAFRSVGVLLCVAGTHLTWKERLFCVIAYLPKATVQAAIGSVPLAAGLACGKLFCLSLCWQSLSRHRLGQSGWMQPIKGCWKRKIKKDFQKVFW